VTGEPYAIPTEAVSTVSSCSIAALVSSIVAYVSPSVSMSSSCNTPMRHAMHQASLAYLVQNSFNARAVCGVKLQAQLKNVHEIVGALL